MWYMVYGVGAKPGIVWSEGISDKKSHMSKKDLWQIHSENEVL